MGTEEAPPGRSIEVALENTTTSVNKDAESYEMPWCALVFPSHNETVFQG